MPLPRFILRGEYSINAKLLYALLLGRTQLSQKSGWVSEDENVYVIYTIRQMANDLNRSERTVKAALAELENAGLIIRVRQGWNRANRIFLRLPDEVQLSSCPEGKFCPMDGLESSPCMGQNLPISKKEKKKTDSSQNNRRENARRCFGQYQNVFLSDSELAELQSTYPDQFEDYINRLSAYMASSGKAADLDERRIYDRVLEVCVPIQFNGENFRKGNAAENVKRAAKILNQGT